MTAGDFSISLEHARAVAEAALEHARALSLRPLTVAILDPGGHLVFLAREDGASILRPRIATGKAFTALALGGSSRQVDEIAAARPAFVASLAHLADQGIVPAAGGVLIAAEGRTIGAVGVSGDTPDNDEACALAGLTATTDRGEY